MLSLSWRCLLLTTLTLVISASFAGESLNDETIAQVVGWVPTPTGLCRGFYLEPQLGSMSRRQSARQTQIFADSANLRVEGISVLAGHVVVRQPGREVRADRARLTRYQNKINTLTLSGNVVYREQGRLLAGKSAHIDLQRENAEVIDAIYRLSRDFNPGQVCGDYLCYGLSAWGQAERITRDKDDNYTFTKATFATCPPNARAWSIAARKIKFNKKTLKGSARGAVFKIRDVPVLYTPYLSFSLDKTRKSGFLVPIVGYSDRGGFLYQQPFYFNLAPNYDMTVSPGFFYKRGFIVTGEGRYLFSHTRGVVQAEYLPKDEAFRRYRDEWVRKLDPGPVRDRLARANIRRGYLAIDHATHFSDHLHATLHYTQVSDDYYLKDFSPNIEQISQNQLLQQATLSYSNQHWLALVRAQHYQTLHPFDQVMISDPYSRLPQAIVRADYPDIPGGFSFHVLGQYDNFYRPNDPTTLQSFVQGQRRVILPALSYPIIHPGFFVVPKLIWHLRSYKLRNQLDGLGSDLDYSIPITSVDAGLLFEKHYAHYTQTLEPRVFYLYVPFNDQASAPNFDSFYSIFTYHQLFRYNRFIGLDRVQNANQLSMSLTTRVVDDETGLERLQLSIGAIYYFKNRLVNLCQGPGCFDSESLLGFTDPDHSFSPLAGLIDYHITDHWHLLANGAYNMHDQNMDNGDVSLHYQNQGDQVFHVTYSFLRNGDTQTDDFSYTQSLHQVSAGLATPLSDHWHLLGNYGYNVSHGFTQQYFAGLSYDSCCWAVRIMGGRSFTGLNERRDPRYHTLFFIQLMLKGLGNFASRDPSGILADTIPGYVDPFKS